MTHLEFARRTRGWTQKYLGHLGTVRISQSFISLCELGRGIPSDDQRQRLARALGLAPEDLLKDVVVSTSVPVVAEPLDDPEKADAAATA